MIPDTTLAGRRVIIGLSGGVDSAVAAFLLKRQGAAVEALHMTNWDDEDGYCTAADDLQDARHVCDQLEIPLHHANFSKDYRESVFEHFLSEYAAGRTPNPDVLCNREIKFGVFRRYAQRLGAELIATGHYARAVREGDVTVLMKARDAGKDQTYFLHAVPQEALADTVFPLGELQKHEVRELAREAGLHVHNKKDSTGICFIGERPFREFLSQYLPANPGPMLAVDGDEVGEHHGLMYYTVGQRQGLGIGGRRDGGDEPWYVVDKRLADNALVVAQGEHPLLYSSSVRVSDPHWIGAAPATTGRWEGHVKIRYRQPDQQCTVDFLPDGSLDVGFAKPQRAVAPGQYAVFYQGDRCLGGGVIEHVEVRAEALRPAV